MANLCGGTRLVCAGCNKSASRPELCLQQKTSKGPRPLKFRSLELSRLARIIRDHHGAEMSHAVSTSSSNCRCRAPGASSWAVGVLHGVSARKFVRSSRQAPHEAGWKITTIMQPMLKGKILDLLAREFCPRFSPGVVAAPRLRELL